jgi:hypothetical protein
LLAAARVWRSSLTERTHANLIEAIAAFDEDPGIGSGDVAQ